MDTSDSAQMLQSWQQRAKKFWTQGEYEEAATFYQEIVEAQPEVRHHYWYLGLMLLLKGEEGDARATWLMGMLDGESEQIEAWIQELVEVLQQEARRQEDIGSELLAWTIRQQVQELCPTETNNLLHLVRLALRLEIYTGNELDNFGVVALLQSDPPAVVEFELLVTVLRQILDRAPSKPSSLELVAASLRYATTEPQILQLLVVLLEAAVEISSFKKQPKIAVSLCELALLLAPHEPEVLYQLARFYQDSEQYEKGIETAKQYAASVANLPEKIFANRAVLRALMGTGGYWQERFSTFQKHEALLHFFKEQQPTNLTPIQISRLYSGYFFAPYFRDEPRTDRSLQNQIARICQLNTQTQHESKVARYAKGHQERRNSKSEEQRLKIGYLSHCFKLHSVGWLARWLFEYRNREHFDLYTYMITDSQISNPLQEWYSQRATQTYKSPNSAELAEKIYEDEIDILVELDSITLDRPCEVVALKPAPIQVTWLGWDASGIPTIDYFIADPYVLPDSAQDYYNEKIWRLPNTYISVDGFEVGIPTLRREDLNIPSNAVVYLSAQTGYKRHIDTARLQLRIVKQVPNSYFLIKGLANLEAVKDFFVQIAEEEGFDTTRLRFLPLAPSEAIHRANLTIADIVLDTYPYNGATTTLETLWMGIPLVTRVGEQFAARNSYTMMVNAGITEGIAWTDEEYVEWGVRLGKNEALRQQVAWKLRQSRHSSPLWNGKQFTLEMEKAYREMWVKYINE
ncbi:MAG: O-linked N-acetylglucosamine transferase, SPINDLY family protein [Cyanobacteriota bacterium]|nr:O-linked N-acetylglucosamine transferase, SPINDLY family protein [Cyanobacteriota bacterium]